MKTKTTYYIQQREDSSEWDVRERTEKHDIVIDICDSQNEAQISCNAMRLAIIKASK